MRTRHFAGRCPYGAEPGHAPGLLGIASMELELGELFGREVELRTYHDLSRYFLDEVQRAARELYAA